MTLSELIKGGKSAFFAVKEEIANDEFAVEINQALSFEWGVKNWVPNQYIEHIAFSFYGSFAMKLPVSRSPGKAITWVRLSASSQIAGLATYLGIAYLDEVDVAQFIKEVPERQFKPQVVQLPKIRAEGLSFGIKGLFVNRKVDNWYGCCVPPQGESLTKADLSLADKPITYVIAQRPYLDASPVPIYFGVYFGVDC